MEVQIHNNFEDEIVKDLELIKQNEDGIRYACASREKARCIQALADLEQRYQK